MAPKHKLRADDVRKMSMEQREKALAEFGQELITLRHKAAVGALTNPGRLRELRRNVARILTIMREERRGAKG
ncbi:MAG: 50S ribosomal protein L29 [Acidilobaceae archaeon]|nr:50S ribosomal protein L29 [Acidilobaceae archaeon]